MSDIILTTFDWVPEMPRGYVRDLRVRWALEEAGLPYRVESTPFRDRGPDHFAHQPFGQAPWLTDGDLSIFESGAILLHLGEIGWWRIVLAVAVWALLAWAHPYLFGVRALP